MEPRTPNRRFLAPAARPAGGQAERERRGIKREELAGLGSMLRTRIAAVCTDRRGMHVPALTTGLCSPRPWGLCPSAVTLE